VDAPLVTTTVFRFGDDNFLLALHWADEAPPRIVGLTFGPPTTWREPLGSVTAAVAAAVGELDRRLREDKRLAWLTAMVEGDDCCFAALVRALAAAEETGRDAVGYGYACRRQVLGGEPAGEP
jgi:hypothetical protein